MASPTPADLPQAFMTKTSLTAMQTILSTPLPRSAAAFSTKPGRCLASQVGVNAPGTENSTTRPLPRSSAAVKLTGPSAPMIFSLPSGILSPALIVIVVFLLPLFDLARRACAGKVARLDEHARYGMAHVLLDPPRRVHRPFEVDAGVDAHASEHVDKVLGRD